MMWEKIALFFIVMFAIIGTMFVSIIVHEYSHYNDFKNFNVSDQRLCAFVLPTGQHISNWTDYIWSPAGYYGYSIDKDNMTTTELSNYKNMEQTTEYRAFAIGALIFAFYMMCYMIITFSRYKDKRKIVEYKHALKDREEYINELETYINSEKQKIL